MGWKIFLKSEIMVYLFIVKLLLLKIFQPQLKFYLLELKLST